MKRAKYAVFLSAGGTLFSLGMYLIGALICFKGNNIVQDIFIAIFSSSVFVVGLSVLDYKIEKRQLIADMYKSCALFELSSIYSFTDQSNSFSQSGLNGFLTNFINNLRNIKYLLMDYYDGCIFKDGAVQKLINDTVNPFLKFLIVFRVYNLSPHCEKEVLIIKLNEDLITKYVAFSNALHSWLDKQPSSAEEGNIDDDLDKFANKSDNNNIAESD